MIECRKFGIKLGEFELSDISFFVPDKKYYCLMGKTGCGKTTILESICGLKTSNYGDIIIDKINVTKLRPSQREIGFVPQDDIVHGNLTVEENLRFNARCRYDI